MQLATGAFLIACLWIVTPIALAGCFGSDADDAASADGQPASGDGKGTSLGSSGKGNQRENPGSKAHVHDYWYGVDQMILFDGAVESLLFHNHLLDEPPREQHTHGCDETLASDSQGGSRKFSLPPGMTVLPGTERLEVTAEWTDPGISGLRLLYRPPGRGHEEGHGHQALSSSTLDHDITAPRQAMSVAGSRAPEGFRDGGEIQSGVPVDIPVAAYETDDGHATLSHWAFFLCADGSTPIDFAEGSVQLLIVAHKAQILLLDPPHPDHWQDANRLLVAQVRSDEAVISAANKGDGAFISIPFAAGAIVAPGSVRLVVTLDASSSSLGAADLTGFALYWRDPTEPDWVFQQQTLTVDDEGNPAFLVPVSTDATDSVYATQTDWLLYLRIRSDHHAATPLGDLAAPDYYDGSVNVHVWTEREAGRP